jgi:hypothetical protein
VAGLLGGSGAAACPRPMGGSPPVAGAAAAPMPPHPQAGGTGRNDPSAPRQHGERGRPPVAGQYLTGKDLGTYQEDGEEAEEVPDGHYNGSKPPWRYSWASVRKWTHAGVVDRRTEALERS